jgi:DNA-directed RNA polymerase specialized sigma24 family protein
MQRDLVIRAREGDADAFEALAAEAFGRLLRTASLILRSDDRAADAVQEALTSAWVHIRAVRDPERFDAWLHRLLVHACYGELRRAMRRLKGGVLSIIEFSPQGDRILFSNDESLWSVSASGSEPQLLVSGVDTGDRQSIEIDARSSAVAAHQSTEGVP